MRLIFLISFWCIGSALWGQKFVAQALSIEEGLSQSTSESIEQDSSGFLWIGTSYGLNRYDSHAFEVFHNTPFDSTSLSCSKIDYLLLDHQNQLWVGNCGGLDILDKKRKEFSTLYFQTEKDNIEKVPVGYLYEDTEGMIWIASSNGLWRYTKGKMNQSDTLYLNEQLLNWENIDSYVSCMLIDKEGKIWIAYYGKGVFCFEWEDGKLIERKRYLTDASTFSISTYAIYDFLEDENGQIWLGTTDGIYYYDAERDKMVYFEQGGQTTVYNFCLETERKYLVGTRAGVFRFDLSGTRPKIDRDIFEQDQFKRLNETLMVTQIKKDRIDGSIYWLATNSRGVVRLERRFNDFQPVLFNQLNINSSVNFIAETGDYTWLDMWDTILIQQVKKDSFFGLGNIRTNKGVVKAERLNNFFVDKEGNLWSGTWEGELIDLTNYLEQGEPAKIYTPPRNQGFVLSMYEVDDLLYIGTYGGHIFIFDKSKKQFLQQSIILSSFYEKYSHPVTSMLCDQYNNFWIGTWQGLFVYRDLTEPLHLGQRVNPDVYLHDDKDFNSIPNHEIQKLIEDTEGNLWAATSQGLIKINRFDDKITFENYTTKNGLPNNHICSIEVDDENKDLWLGTRGGLTRFNFITEKVDNFFTKDGLQGKEFNIFSSFKNRKGEILLGGTNGYNRFHPRDIKIHTTSFPIYLTELVTNDGTNIDLLNREAIELTYAQNSFALHFVGLNFKETEGLQFVYELEGEAGTQTSVNDSRQINFYKLPPGTYSLKVFMLKNDLPYGESADRLTIHISSPIWLRPWFYVLLAMALFGMVYLFFNWRYHQRLEKIQMIERVRKNAAEDFHDELGSKLTVITLNSRMLESELSDTQKNVGEYLQKITQTSSKLIDAMRDMLWTLNPDRDTIADLYDHLNDFGEQFYEYTGVQFHSSGLESNLKKQALSIESQRHILLIFKEAMNNSLRHSKAKNVFFTISKKNKNTLFVEFRDDGEGFDTASAASGYGLKNMQSRAQKINAEITIDSNSQGTRTHLSVLI